MNRDYDGRQYVEIDLHRRRSVIVRMTPDGEQLGWVRINNDPVALGLELAKAGPAPRRWRSSVPAVVERLPLTVPDQAAHVGGSVALAVQQMGQG